MATNSIQNYVGTQTGYRPEFLQDRRSAVLRGNEPGAHVRAAKVEVSSDKTRTFELTTDDGDTVTISIETSAQLEAGGFKTKGPNGRAIGGSISGDFDLSVNVEVTGELDAEEIADIRSLVWDAIRGGNPEPRPAGPPPAGELPVSLPPETEVVVAAETSPAETSPIDEPPTSDVPLPVEDDGTTIASYSYNTSSDVQTNFSRIHDRATWG